LKDIPLDFFRIDLDYLFEMPGDLKLLALLLMKDLMVEDDSI
jgi:hypothetical protein